MTTPIEEEKKRQIEAYLKEYPWLSSGQSVDATHPDYFAVSDNKVLYAAKTPKTLAIDDRQSKGDVIIPKGVDGASIVYTPPLTKNVLVDNSPYGSSGRDEQEVRILGNNNRVTFVENSAGGKVTVEGDSNVITTGKDNDTIVLSRSNGNTVSSGSGNDMVIDRMLQPYNETNQNMKPNIFSGGEGADAYQLSIYRGYKYGKTDTRMKDSKIVNVGFDAQGSAHVTDAKGNKFAVLAADVEHFEIKLEKGDIAKDCADDTYRIDLKAMRESFLKSNVTLNGEATGDVTPTRVEITFGGVKASTANNPIRVQKISGKCPS